MTENGLVRFLRNLRAGGRLVFFMPVGRFDFRYSQHQLVLLIAAAFGLALVGDYLAVETPRAFNHYGFITYTLSLAALFVATYLVIAVQRTPTMFTALVIVLLSSGLIMNAIWWLAVELPQDIFEKVGRRAAWWVWWFLLAWAVFVKFRAIRTLCSAKVVRGLILATVCTAVWTTPSYIFGWSRFWNTKQVTDNSTVRRPTIDVERTYYAQPRLLRGRLRALADNRPDIVDLYFLGFAGASYQDVFMREVRSVTRLFQERFDTRGRSLGLINNPATVETHPLANTHNLYRALRGIANKMDTEQDVLFLFLTSHGTKSATLETRFWPLQQNALSAENLATVLDRSGIKWRVIVVSACYSGSFIKSLENDHTLVITASRPDRNSFGCSNEAEFTYFGRAYFDEALRTNRSFIDAFEIARDVVTEREKKEGFEPSEPQIAVGRHIAAKLRELESRLEHIAVTETR